VLLVRLMITRLVFPVVCMCLWFAPVLGVLAGAGVFCTVSVFVILYIVRYGMVWFPYIVRLFLFCAGLRCVCDGVFSWAGRFLWGCVSGV